MPRKRTLVVADSGTVLMVESLALKVAKLTSLLGPA
jgi:hypothetical protein